MTTGVDARTGLRRWQAARTAGFTEAVAALREGPFPAAAAPLTCRAGTAGERA